MFVITFDYFLWLPVCCTDVYIRQFDLVKEMCKSDLYIYITNTRFSRRKQIRSWLSKATYIEIRKIIKYDLMSSGGYYNNDISNAWLLINTIGEENLFILPFLETEQINLYSVHKSKCKLDIFKCLYYYCFLREGNGRVLSGN